MLENFQKNLKVLENLKKNIKHLTVQNVSFDSMTFHQKSFDLQLFNLQDTKSNHILFADIFTIAIYSSVICSNVTLSYTVYLL